MGGFELGITESTKGKSNTAEGCKWGKMGSKGRGAARAVKAVMVEVSGGEVGVSHKVNVNKGAGDGST